MPTSRSAVLGGRVMHLVDMCAWLAAQRHSCGPAVTAAIDQMSFVHPIPIGRLVILRSSVNRVFRTSMEVGVKVWVEDPKTGEVRHTSSAYLTFVAIGENGKPVPVAPVIAESEEEKRQYHEAGRRRVQRLAARNSFAPSEFGTGPDQASASLAERNASYSRSSVSGPATECAARAVGEEPGY
jgi:acyl-CoA hydrolase